MRSASPPRTRPLVLCYHAVSAGWPHSLSVDPRAFERQLALLLRRYRPVAADDAIRGTGRLLHVTFDDAFRSVENALPVLAKLGIPATVFASTDFAADGRPLVVDELAAAAAAYPTELATLSWDRLAALAEQGIEIGSHTCSHAHLTRLADDELDRELRESRARIEDELRRPCRFLAYPYGEQDARVRSAARRAGYVAAFALPGDASVPDDFAVPRLGIWRRDSLVRVAAKLAFGRGRRPGWLREALR